MNKQLYLMFSINENNWSRSCGMFISPLIYIKMSIRRLSFSIFIELFTRMSVVQLVFHMYNFRSIQPQMRNSFQKVRYMPLRYGRKRFNGGR